MEFNFSNVKTDVICNTWEFFEYSASSLAVVAGLFNQFPMSWGTVKQSSGNVWINDKADMWNLSTIDNNINYYYLPTEADEIFAWEVGFTEFPAGISNSECTYSWPANASMLDTNEYIVSGTRLTEEYQDVLDSIAYIESNADTTQISVKEEIAELERRLSHLVGQGMLFHTTPDSQFWSVKANLKVIELLGLNHLWYGHFMDSIQGFLASKSDTDAQALHDAAGLVLNYIGNGKDLYGFTTSQVDSLRVLAESSFGDYTNLLRNFLYMVYDIFIPWDNESIIDSLRSEGSIAQPQNDEVYTHADEFTVSPNPFIDNIHIRPRGDKRNDMTGSVQVFSLGGSLVYSIQNTGIARQLNLDELQPGGYILKIEDKSTGKKEVHKIFKSDY